MNFNYFISAISTTTTPIGNNPCRRSTDRGLCPFLWHLDSDYCRCMSELSQYLIFTPYWRNNSCLKNYYRSLFKRPLNHCLSLIKLSLKKIQNGFLSDNSPPKYEKDKKDKMIAPEISGNKTVDEALLQIKLAKNYGINYQGVGLQLAHQLYNVSRQTGTDNVESYNFAIAMVNEFKPQDAVEALLINQMVSIHLLMMESAKRAAIEHQPYEGQVLYLREVNKLSRTFAAQVAALDKHRGKGQQKMTVEHVHVNEGGQAIIGNVDSGANNKNSEKNQGGI